jgi:hypothetical protein
MSKIETIDVKKVKVQRESAQAAAKKVQQLEDKKDMKFKVKAIKTPLNKGASGGCHPMELYEPQEYKLAPALMLVEAVARGVPSIAPADYERLKQRLLHSPDFQHLSEKIMMDYTIQNDKLKLLMTILVHSANEIITSAMEQPKESTLKSAPQQVPNQPQKGASAPAPVQISLEPPGKIAVPDK